jgi:hypothetical protein
MCKALSCLRFWGRIVAPQQESAEKMRSHRLALLLALPCAAIPATAQSLCGLVPAAVVQSTLGIPATLTADTISKPIDTLNDPT